MAKEKGNLLGSWSFLIGVILAIILGAIGAISAVVATILVVLGLIVGLLNITASEVHQFLMAGAVLVIVAALGKDVLSVVAFVGNILDAILIMFVPATMVVALKSVFSLARR